MYKIIICDDDKEYIQELRETIEECNAGQRKLSFMEFYSGEELLEHIPMDSDVLFLDIMLGDINGNEVAVRLKKNGYQGLLIQCSGVYTPTPETVKISPYRYLLKQFDKETTNQDICEIFEEMDRRKACFALEPFYRRRKVIVHTMDVAYITHHKRGSCLHLCKERQEEYSDGNLIVPYNFQKLLEKLRFMGFVCPHNSYMLNLHYVSKFHFETGKIELEGKTFVIARGKRKQFAKEFSDYINQKYEGKL